MPPQEARDGRQCGDVISLTSGGAGKLAVHGIHPYFAVPRLARRMAAPGVRRFQRDPARRSCAQ